MQQSWFKALVVCVVALGVTSFAAAQTKKKNASRGGKTATETAKTKPAPAQKVEPLSASPKRNERPDASTTSTQGDPNAAPIIQAAPFRYEFDQPDFVTSKVIIEHDDAGKGTISFQRRGGDEMFTDPLTVSPATMKRLNEVLTALNFLDSTENYQYSKDYSHLGNMKITMNRAGRSRTAAFNFTENKNAKALAELYRGISNQALWVFDIIIARENQRLETPNQMKSLESLIKRGEIADPEQMLPMLRELSDDERLPLIARNNATRIIQSIEKGSKKN